MSTARALEATTTTDRHDLPRVLVLLTIVAAATVVAVALLTAPGSVTDTVTETVVAPSGASSSTSGAATRSAGDGCALRLEAGGGFLEDIHSANRCGQPSGHEVRGGIQP